MEHHSNIVPWQLLAERTGAILRWFDVTDEGRLDLESARRPGLVNERTKIISVDYVSNVLGTVNPVQQIAEPGATRSARPWCWMPRRPCLQLPVDVVASVLIWWRSPATRWSGPTGIGVLWGVTTCSPSCPFLGRRGDDRDRSDERIDLCAAASSVRGRHATHRSGGRARRRGCYLGELGMDQIAAHEQEITRTPWAGCEPSPG